LNVLEILQNIYKTHTQLTMPNKPSHRKLEYILKMKWKSPVHA